MPRRLTAGLLAFVLALSGLLLPAAATSTHAAPLSQQGDGDTDDELVYIDGNGIIRVLDRAGAEPRVQWFSPTDGWDEIALGDFNNDTDMEIVAIDEDTNRLAVFDPVSNSGASADQKINDIPWETLYEEVLPDRPRLVGAGDLDAGIAGDEIIYAYDLPGDRSLVRVIKSNKPNPDGREWVEHIASDFGRIWNRVTVGPINDSGPDEVVLIDSNNVALEKYTLSVYDLERGFGKNANTGEGDDSSGLIFRNRSDSDERRGAAIGQVSGGGTNELAIIREGNFGNLIIFKYRSSPNSDNYFLEEDEDDYLSFTPAPRFVFMADVNGSGDEEVLFLRNTNFEESARLVMLNRGDDGTIKIESSLGGVEGNAYRVGAGADVDGDGRDEIVIMGRERIRIYTEAERSIDPFDDIDTPTNGESLRAGNLNTIGFTSGPRFVLQIGGQEIAKINGSVPTGVLGDPINVRLADGNNVGTPGFSYSVVGNPSWIEVSSNATRVPALLTLRFNAGNLAPGDYTATLRIVSTDPSVINSPFDVEVELEVTAADVIPQPASVASVYFPCTDDNDLDSRTESLLIGGTPDVRFNMALISAPTAEAATAALNGRVAGASLANGRLTLSDASGNTANVDLSSAVSSASAASTDATRVTWPSDADWVTVETDSADLVVPTNVTLTVDPSARNSDMESAVLVIVADTRAGEVPENVRLIPVTLLCAESQVNLPVVTSGAITR